MRRLHTRKGGFTLIELMIVVAIIGILAAIAIPNFLRFQLRSRAGEGKVNIAGIRTAEEAYFAEYNTYVSAAAAGNAIIAPAGGSSEKAEWAATNIGFDTIGWFPEGAVYYTYQANTGVDGAGNPAYSVGGTSDIDADGTVNSWGYVHASPAAAGVGIAPPLGAGCTTAGVFNPQTPASRLVNTVGPCTPLDGQDQF